MKEINTYEEYVLNELEEEKTQVQKLRKSAKNNWKFGHTKDMF